MWDARRHEFDLFTSQLVLDEASEGEPAKATERLELLAGLELLDLNDRSRLSPPNWCAAASCLPPLFATHLIWLLQEFTE